VKLDLERTEVDPDVREKMKRKKAARQAADIGFASDSDVVEVGDEQAVTPTGEPPTKPRSSKKERDQS
jgi:hypothetical protein